MRNAALPITGATDCAQFVLTSEWLTSREFIFRVGNMVASRSMRFHPDGTIAGYIHPNESFWQVSGGELHFMNSARQTTCILTAANDQDGPVRMAGRFIDVARPLATDVNTHSIEETRADDATPKVASFDLFDTLVARKCFDPISVFRAVEDRSGVPDFARIRHETEMRLFGRTVYGLDDVYAAMEKERGWSPEFAAKLKNLELAEEWETLFPIREIVALVGPNDFVISDMYLPYEFIRRVVEEKCGLRGRPILLSNYGKHLGLVWPQVLSNYEILLHHGDSLHADIASPSRFGIPTRHVTVSAWTAGERILMDIGLPDCARAVREARLRDDPATPEARALRAAQLQFNLPLLIVGGYFVLQSAREFGADRLLLCARDSCLLEPVVKLIARLTGAPIAIRYIRASRKLFYSVSVEYEVYFRQQLGAKTLLVDLVGGGGSSCHFLKSANLETRVKPAIVVVGELAAESYEGIAVESLVKKASVPVMMAIESLNSSLEGSALSAEIRNFLVEINLAPNEFRPAAQRLISQMHEVAETAIGTINESVSRLPSEIPHEILLQAGNALVALIPEHWQGMQLLLLEHIQNLAH